MDASETIQKLTEACQDLMQMVNELKEENTFLTDTICNQKMGKITTERRQLLARANQAESDSKTAIAEANTIKSEYEHKLDKIIILIKDVKSKQSDIDAYIDCESDNKIQSQKDKLNNNYKKQKQKLQEEFNQKESQLTLLVVQYKKRQYVGIIVGIIGVITGVLGFMFWGGIL